MANKNPKGKRFQKGEINNPLGAGAHNKKLKAIKRLTHDEIAEIGSLLLEGNYQKLKSARQDRNESALKRWICQLVMNGMKNGNAQSLNTLLDRIIGKPKEDPKTIVIQDGAPLMSQDEVDERVDKANKKC